LSRAGASGEVGLTGRITVGLYAGAQAWNAESWGASLGLAAGVGNASEDITQNVTISLRGLMSGTTTDNVILRNFTVLRYPAQTNP
jgi:hypothetical protein